MSSGFGLRGGIGRCYPFWAEYKECLVRICGVVLAPLRLWGRRRLRFDDQYDGRPSDLRRCHV